MKALLNPVEIVYLTFIQRLMSFGEDFSIRSLDPIHVFKILHKFKQPLPVIIHY